MQNASIRYRLAGNYRVHCVFVRDPGGFAVEDDFLAGFKLPIVQHRKQLAAFPEPGRLFFRRREKKRFGNEYVHRRQPTLGGMIFVRFKYLAAQLRPQIMQRTAGIKDIKRPGRAVVVYVGTENIDRNTGLLGKAFCFFHTGEGQIERADAIAEPRKKYGILTLAAADIEHTQRPHRRTEPYDLQTERRRYRTPIILVGIVPRLIRRFGRDIVRIAGERIDARLHDRRGLRLCDPILKSEKHDIVYRLILDKMDRAPILAVLAVLRTSEQPSFLVSFRGEIVHIAKSPSAIRTFEKSCEYLHFSLLVRTLSALDVCLYLLP